MIPGPRRGHVYLTPWTVSQSAVRPPLRVDLGMICRVSGASIWQAAHLYAAETLLRWQTVSLLITVNSRWVHLEHLYSALTGGKLKLTSDFKYLRLFCSHAELKRRSQQVFKKERGDSPVLESQKHWEKKNIKESLNPRWPEYNWGLHYKHPSKKLNIVVYRVKLLPAWVWCWRREEMWSEWNGKREAKTLEHVGMLD